METLVFLPYPPTDIGEIERIVRERESFVALIDGDIYSIGQHIAERPNFEFSAELDRNVYTRITALVRGGNFHPRELDDLRWAAAILAFCQLSRVIINHTSSLYEYAHTNGDAAALEELHRFRVADNSDPKIFINFALGRTLDIPRDSLANITASTAEIPPGEFVKPLRDFRINYTFALKIAELVAQNIPDVEKMILLLDWMYAEFFFGAPAVLFASRLFSPNRHKRMMKDLTKAGIENAAWDMTFVQGWRRSALQGLKTNKPVILISGDKAVRDMARRITAESEDEARETMREIWGRNTSDGKRVYEHYLRAWESASSGNSKDRKPPNYDSQVLIMRDLERRVFRQ